MSTFYLLPPRPILGKRFSEFLGSVFPGLRWSDGVWSHLADALGAAAEAQGDVYVVYREDLPAEDDVGRALRHAFGAETGDEVVEIDPLQDVRRWRV